MQNSADHDQMADLKLQCFQKRINWAGGGEVMLKSTQLEMHHAYKCKNANKCWYFNIYYQDKKTSESVFIFQQFSFMSIAKISCSVELSMKKVLQPHSSAG